MSVGLASHYAGTLTTLAVCLKITREDGMVIAATNHDQDILLDDDSPSTLYLSAIGGTDTDVQTSNALNVDTLDQRSVLSLDSLTDEDIHAGLYNDAVFSFFAVNYADLTQGVYRLRDGKIGVITVERATFVAHLQGMMDALKRTIGLLILPLCPYNLGDLPFPAPYRGRCTKDLTTFTVTGTLESAGIDGATLADSARTEPGPAASVNILGVTNANPGVVTTDAPINVADGEAVSLSGIVGPAALNTIAVIHNPTATTFELETDTSDTGAYPPYVSGGVATPLGGASGYFDYGLFTPDTGAHAGQSREIKWYVPGQWQLQLPYEPALLGTEDYTMIAGCNKSSTTCKAKFDNFLNFGGFPFVPGQDKIIQVAQPQGGQSQGNKK